MLKEQLKSHINRIYQNTLNMLGEFDSNFMVGLITGFMILALALFRYYGVNFAMTPGGQFHLVTYLWVICCIPLAYYILQFEPNNGKRVLASVLFPVFVFSIHDVAWLIETFYVPQIFRAGFLYNPTFMEYFIHFVRNTINLMIPLIVFIMYKYVHLNKGFWICLAGQVGFHLMDIVFQISYPNNAPMLLVMEIVDTLPYLFLVGAKQIHRLRLTSPSSANTQ